MNCFFTSVWILTLISGITKNILTISIWPYALASIKAVNPIYNINKNVNKKDTKNIIKLVLVYSPHCPLY